MSAKIQEYKASIHRSLCDKSKPWTKYFDKAEQKTGVSRVYIFIGLVAFTGLYLVFGFGAELICNTIGFVYPAYMSMKALETKSKDDDTKWLTYWVVFACFSVVEYFSDFIVGWFPLYWLLKCIFVIWCFLPDCNGSLVIYNRIIRPYYQKHHGRIDDIASTGCVNVRELVQSANFKIDYSMRSLKMQSSENDPCKETCLSRHSILKKNENKNDQQSKSQ